MLREQGSSFYKLSKKDTEYQILKNSEVQLNQQYAFYYSGRSAMFAVLEHINSNQKINTLWIPDYYCQNVVNFLKRNYPNLKTYYINAFNCSQNFNYLRFTKKDDVIILNNFWGLFTYAIDKKSIHRPTIIEDFSHGWLTKQCLNSAADYCIASVRKSYPIPGGGVAWIPNKPFNFHEDAIDDEMLSAFETLDASISEKSDFLKQNKGSKQSYLELLNKGETHISASNSYVHPQKELSDLIETHIKLNPNIPKAANLKIVRPLLRKNKHFKIVERKGFEPFGLLLLFKEKMVYDNFKLFCVSHKIYPANLWPNNQLRTEWKHFLNFHVDFRYNDSDMKYLAEIINHWSSQNI